MKCVLANLTQHSCSTVFLHEIDVHQTKYSAALCLQDVSDMNNMNTKQIDKQISHISHIHILLCMP